MNQTYHTRGLLAFIEDQCVIAIEAFLSNDQAGVIAALEKIIEFAPRVREEVKATR